MLVRAWPGILASQTLLFSRYAVAEAPPGVVLDADRGSFGSGAPLSSTTFSSIVTATRAGTATYRDANGNLQTAAADEARVNHHIWKGGRWQRRLLIEPGSTNLVINSEDLLGTGWNHLRASVTYDATEEAWRVTAENDGDDTTRGLIHNSTTGVAPCSSVEIKKGNHRYVIIGTGNLAYRRCVFDLDTGEVVDEFRSGNSTIEKLSAGWFRVSYLSDSDVSQYDSWSFGFTDTPTGNTSIGDGSKYAFIRRPQSEARQSPTSYIPTGASQVSRAADSVQIDAGKWPFSSGGFSVALDGEVTYFADADGGENFKFYESQAGGVKNIRASIGTNGPRLGNITFTQSDPESGNSSSGSGSSNDLEPGALVEFNMASRHSPTGIVGALFGTAFAEAAATELFDLSTRPFTFADGAVFTIKTLRIWGVALSDAALEEATS